MCIKFVAWLIAANTGYHVQNKPHPHIAFEMGPDINHWGKRARLHMLHSVCAGNIDLHDEVIQDVKVVVELPLD